MDSFCSASPLDLIKAEDEYSPCPSFSFSLKAILSFPISDDSENDDELLPNQDRTTRVSQEVSLPYDVVMMGDEICRVSAIRNMLLELGVDPVEPFMVSKILDCAGTMSANKRFAGRRVLRMEVQIEGSGEYLTDDDDDDDDEEEDMDDDDDDDEEEWEWRTEGASKESIEELRKVKVEEGSEADGCSICCEEFVMGFEATLMPCSHRFHGDCINKWLVKSKFCPLCRFELIN